GRVVDLVARDGRWRVWRLFCAHANSGENLPLFAAVVLVAAVAGRSGAVLDALAGIYLCARIAQSIVHVRPGAGLRFNVRFGFFVVQLVCLLGFVVAIVWSPT